MKTVFSSSTKHVAHHLACNDRPKTNKPVYYILNFSTNIEPVCSVVTPLNFSIQYCIYMYTPTAHTYLVVCNAQLEFSQLESNFDCLLELSYSTDKDTHKHTSTHTEQKRIHYCSFIGQHCSNISNSDVMVVVT